ncbi:alpha-2-macroglobulin family protein [Biostraticola tofi]|uniref:Alpha-2-macroglobulin n=1 Tax=Biostraticola tofi TaxID=466109 RepID=A0A4R3YT74_9GAMM|nr:alpha-2-macroglobulin [Biostraticola tofi]TCV94313.1 hypothetical protein EDC52_10753 [Biostraticola tofi]
MTFSLISASGCGKRRYQGAMLAAILALLAGCDDKPGQAAAPTSADGTPAHPAASVTKPDSASVAALAKKTAGKPLTLLDASEIQLDGASTLVLTFSVPLDPSQDFSALAQVVDTKAGKPDGAWELSPSLTELRLRHLQPNRKLMVTVNGGMRAANGATLGEEQQHQLTTRDIQPSVGFASKGSLLPTRLAEGLPVMALNVDKIDVNFFRIRQAALPAFITDWQYRTSFSTWESDEWLSRADLVYSGRFDLNPEKNTRQRLLLPLSGIEPLKQPGVYLAVMQQAGHYSYSNPATLFSLSDIGVSLHRYHDRMDVFSQSLADGKPLGGAQLQVLDDKGGKLAEASTEANGHARLTLDPRAKILLAMQQGHTSLIDLSSAALDLTEFDIGGPKGYSKNLFAFGPRDVYRPGELLQINGLLRDADGKQLAAQPINVEVIKPDGQVARTFVWQPENGLYRYQYPIAASAATGDWSLRFNLGDNQPRSYSFKVEDFMPERMALELTSGDQQPAMDSPLTFGVSGRYLYGAPAAGNQLQAQIFMRPMREAVPQLPGFEFGNISEENLSRTLNEFEASLDDLGKADIAVDNTWSDVRSPLNIILQASLLESGGRPVTRRADQAVWPAQTLAGIRPLFAQQQVYDYTRNDYTSQYMVDENSQAEFDIVYAGAKGEKRAVQGLKARLVRERRDYYWEWSEGSGWDSRFDKKDLLVAEDNIDITAGNSAKVSFGVEWGAYRLDVIDPENDLVSSTRFWAGYSWQDNTAGSGAVRPDKVKLKLDKPAYHPGDKVKLHIQAPAAGKGYLLVESGEGPLWWQEISVPEQGMDIDVPLDKDWNRHDLYLSALVIRPGDKQLQSTPKRAVGVLHLPLAGDKRKIDLALNAPARVRPNQTLTVKVNASRKDGKLPDKVHVLLSAVDAGILNITEYKTPDPFDAFLGRKRYGVDQYDVYGQLIDAQGRLANLRYGGDGDDEDVLSRGGKKPITEVTIVAQQAQPVQLDANGEGEVKLAIPEFNGELRLMAQAWSDDNFGSADAKVVVAAPVVVEMSTPRFLAGGDTTHLSLDVSNMSGQPQTLNLQTRFSGLVASGNTATATSSVQLANGQRKTVTLPVTALTGFGQGEVSVTVSGLTLPGESAADYHRSWKIGVRPAYPAQTQHFAALLQPGAGWMLPPEALSGLAPRTAEGRLLLTRNPPLNLARYIAELKAYPYGCLEQTTSGLYPSLYSSQEQLASLGIKGENDDTRRQAIDIGIEHLLGMQRDNGGFGLWSQSSQEEYWLTAYVTDFLVRAREQGYSVSSQALDKANERLKRYLQDASQIDVPYSSQQDYTRFAVQAYAGLVLARQQQAPLGALRQIYQHRDQALSGLPVVQLGIALRLMGDMPRAQTAIAAGLALPRQEDSDSLADYGSPVRDSALILALLNEYQLLPTERDKLMISLADQLYGRNWLSTQESNAVFLAGRNLIGASEPAWQVSFNQGSPTVSQKALNLSYDARQLEGGLQLTNTGDAPLYSRFDLTGYPQQPPAASGDSMSISREYFDLNGNHLSLAQIHSGQLVLVHLRVTAEVRVPDALVVDLLPAGLELENQNLTQSSASLGEAASGVNSLLEAMEQADIKHQEFRDDRYVAAVDISPHMPVSLLYLSRAVTPGNYAVPPPQVESMYVPQRRATGETPERLNVR